MHADWQRSEDLALEAGTVNDQPSRQAIMLAAYFYRMADINDHEPQPGNVPYSGAQAFRHAAELVAMLARGEHILGLQ